ncbi:hypothetical protein [Terribacillus saccharophilus]|uniref:hypothetical protein n=1 Tax=Terribacillus saccharophilus TaxID=361277 RepID=UPI003D2AA5E7
METRVKSSLDIYYEKLNEIFNFINNEEYVQETLDSLLEPTNQEFDDLMVKLVELSDEVSEAETKQEFYPHVNTISDLISKVLNICPDFFGNFKHFNSLYFTILRKLLENDEVDLTGINCNSDFRLFEIDIDKKGFFFNSSNIEDSFLIISLSDENDIRGVLDQISLEFLFYILEELDFNRAPSENKFCLINKDNPLNENNTINIKKIYSVINLKNVSLGKTIHKNFGYQLDPSVSQSLNWNFQDEYQQFNDVIYILSEYNEQQNILDKYLKMYQVIENFMYRSTICKLVNGSSPNMFSIRQFQNLFKKIDGKELDALSGFVSTILDKSYDASINFKTFLVGKWDTFFSSTNQAEVETALNEINVSVSPFAINDQNFKKFISQLVYFLRNSVVHNKETEFHLSYGNLETYPGFQLILEDYLLTVLEEIVYHLLIKRNDIIWYNRSSLTLYN